MGTQNNCRPRKKKKMMKESEFNDGDLISKLPDPLLHHIFSFLDMKFVIQTCVLSTRWRDLWISQPIMNFDEQVFDPSKYSQDHNIPFPHEHNLPADPNHKYFGEFVEKALFLHSTSKIHTFRVKCEDECQGMTVDLDNWMPTLNRRNVEVLDLQIEMTEGYSMFELPESFFKCKSLTTFKLNFGPTKNRGFFKIVEDEEYDVRSLLGKLKVLHLRSIRLDGGIQNLISLCRNLETLVISNCKVSSELDIYHSQLRHLVLEKLERGRITVCASSLMSFRCRDYPINDYSFAHAYFLVEADIDTDYYLTNSEFKWSHSVNMGKCLSQLHGVSSLTLSACLLQLVFGFPNNGFKLPRDQFCNLRFLTLKTSLLISQIRATMILLKKCPLLETLVLKMTEPPLCERADKEEQNWEAKLAPKCIMHQLKFVEIWDNQASVNELEFLKYLLKNAAILEKLVVHTPPELSNNPEELRRFSAKLRLFGGISSSVRMLFL